jgi:hypothetical protein
MKRRIAAIKIIVVSAAQYAKSLAVSAAFWYLLLAMAGPSAVAAGVSIQYGTGHGLIVLGLFAVVGSELLRRGMMRV